MKPLNLEDVEKSIQELSFPKQITMETTTYCNLACIMCPYKSMQRYKGHMNMALYKKCIDEVAKVSPATEIWMALHGEALLLGDTLLEMIQYTKEQSIEHVLLNTNGVLLDKEMSEGLIESGVDDIIFGLDGFAPEIYESIRQGANYKQVHDNILKLVNLIEKKGYGPKVSIQFIVMDENQHEENEFKQYWLNKGLNVKIRRMLNWGGSVPDRKGDNNSGYHRIPCPWVLNVMHVLWDGTIPRCGGDHEAHDPKDNAWNNSLYDIWNGPMSKDRLIHLHHRFQELPDQCLKCSDWRAGGSELFYPTLNEGL